MSDAAREAFDPLTLLRRRWRRVALLALVALAVSVAYALLAAKWYQAQLAVVPSIPPKSGGGGLGASALVAALDIPVDLGTGASSSDVERISAVLRSVSVTDAVIAKFNLMARYRLRYQEDARLEVWSHCSTRVERKPGVVFLTCEDQDPQVAKAMVEYFGEYGNAVFQRISVSSAREERRFLERRVAEARRDLDESAKRRREFQEKNKIVDLPEQSKAVVSAMANLRAELLAKEVQLSYLGGFSARDESGAEQLQRQVEVLKAKLDALEEIRQGPAPDRQPTKRGRAKREGSDGAGGMFPPAMSVPRLRFELEQLYRDQKIQETLFLLLTQRYETARVSEARDTPTFQILDAPTVATRKSRPRRVIIVATGLLLGLALGVGFVLVPAWWRTLPSRSPTRAA